jgi:hypothetical protein
MKIIIFRAAIITIPKIILTVIILKITIKIIKKIIKQIKIIMGFLLQIAFRKVSR